MTTYTIHPDDFKTIEIEFLENFYDLKPTSGHTWDVIDISSNKLHGKLVTDPTAKRNHVSQSKEDPNE